jgi:hypothetical protein
MTCSPELGAEHKSCSSTLIQGSLKTLSIFIPRLRRRLFMLWPFNFSKTYLTIHQFHLSQLSHSSCSDKFQESGKAYFLPPAGSTLCHKNQIAIPPQATKRLPEII